MEDQERGRIFDQQGGGRVISDAEHDPHPDDDVVAPPHQNHASTDQDDSSGDSGTDDNAHDDDDDNHSAEEAVAASIYLQAANNSHHAGDDAGLQQQQQQQQQPLLNHHEAPPMIMNPAAAGTGGNNLDPGAAAFSSSALVGPQHNIWATAYAAAGGGGTMLQQQLPPTYDPSTALAMYYEAKMRDHAAAYAQAAVCAAAHAAAQAMAGTTALPPPYHHLLQPPSAATSAAAGGFPILPSAMPPPPQFGLPTDYVPDHHSIVGSGNPLIPSPHLPPPPNWHPDNQQPQPFNLEHEQQPQPPMKPRPRLALSDQQGYFNHQQNSVHQQHRRKRRQQRLPPSDGSGEARSANHNTTRHPPTHNSQQQQQQRGKIRRRLRSDSSSSGSSFMKNNRIHKKKKANDESLIGKTGVSALYEWCSKRGKTPTFMQWQEPSSDAFDCIVRLESTTESSNNGADGNAETTLAGELGRGRGSSKIVAKQDAARRALQALLPGVIFDSESGLLVELPGKCNSMDDLVPNLAKQLAIGRESSKPKRSLAVYPETSTTTSEEDSVYYASRGASICSQLLHAIVQIDSTRLPEPPEFIYNNANRQTLSGVSETAPEVNNNGSFLPPKATSVARVMKGSFTCTGRLRVLATAVARKQGAGEDEDDDEAGGQTVETLQAVGVGGTKREARHVASAKLLALLFPECKDMAEVKAAAEAIREQYAKSKAVQKQQASKDRNRKTTRGANHLRSRHSRPEFAFAHPTDLSLPRRVEDELRALLDSPTKRTQEHVDDDDLVSSVNAVALSENVDESSASAFRRLSRQKQVDSLVESALLDLNDRDEEGRTLPEELTADDVGRTVLRRAEPVDLPCIKKLFYSDKNGKDHFSPRRGIREPSSQQGPIQLVPERSRSFLSEGDAKTENASSELVGRLWSPTSIVLLLCRAIAAYEDPPMGCAVLTLGFSMEKGRILRLAQIASEPHLPQERFIECLENFAKCMKCGFEGKPHPSPKLDGYLRLTWLDLSDIVKSHVISDQKPPAVPKMKSSGLAETLKSSGISQLQSVREESEASEESSSSSEKRSARQTTKPSKRSRVQ